MARSLLLVPFLLLAGCGINPPLRTMACADARPPTIVRSSDGRFDTTTLSVLTYNMEGLGWPARTGRGDDLGRIGRALAAMREAGTAPDIVLFQEMFSTTAKRAVEAADYPAIVSGPHRTRPAHGSTKDPLPGRSRLNRGELGLHIYGSGLAIASIYPVLHVDRRAYGRKSCAGYDCLANKGVLLARIAIPGVPSPIDVYDTHMNSRGASRVAAIRNLAAHDRQALEASEFIDRTHDDAFPLIFGGDFNMRHSEERWANFTRYQSLRLVHQVCADPASGCDVRMSWDGDEPWMDTQDLQFFWNGEVVSVRPIRVEAMFDGSPGEPVLSDHDGFRVTYELRWPSGSAPQAGC
ncbi:MAG: metal-dependent hydrolase [Sphingobium sp.]|nr:MAG: metal-dependent hydrolase [Sphingobium sp.]